MSGGLRYERGPITRHAISMDPTALWLYFVLVFGIVVVPGMDMLFVLANALSGGRRAGLAATAGIMLGGACHTLFGTAFVTGLSRLVPAVSTAMMVVGSLYMIWIGWTLVRSSITVGAIGTAPRRSDASIFRQGLLTCLLNPKAWLFVLAVFPQFIRPGDGPVWLQASLMGVVTVAVQMLVYGGLGMAATAGRDALTGSPAVTVWLGRCAGALLIAVAALALFRVATGS
jgi:threonine/homoserine/homoserine lactone efflux protein